MIAGFAGFGLVYTVLCVVLGLAAAVVVPGCQSRRGHGRAARARSLRPLARRLPEHRRGRRVDADGRHADALVDRRPRYRAYPESRIGEETELAAGKAAIPVIAAVCCVFASLRPGSSSSSRRSRRADCSAGSGGIRRVFWRRGTSQGAILSMIAGALTMIVPLGVEGELPRAMALRLTLAVSTASYVLASLLSPREKCADAFVDASRGNEGNASPTRAGKPRVSAARLAVRPRGGALLRSPRCRYPCCGAWRPRPPDCGR